MRQGTGHSRECRELVCRSFRCGSPVLSARFLTAVPSQTPVAGFDSYALEAISSGTVVTPPLTTGEDNLTHVNLDIKVDFPTDGNPTNPTLAIPVLATSKPIPPPPPPPLGVISSRLSLANLAIERQRCNFSSGHSPNRPFSCPRWYLHDQLAPQVYQTCYTSHSLGVLVPLRPRHLLLDILDLLRCRHDECGTGRCLSLCRRRVMLR